MNNNNVFKHVPYYKWNSPKNIWDNIKLFFRRFKWAYQRATRGYADCDIWNMESWLLDLLHDSLNHLADHHWGWPGTEQFPNDEDWEKYLKEMAQLFYQANEINEYYPTPEATKWWDWSCDHPHKLDEKSNNPYIETMMTEETKNGKMRDADFHKAWRMMEDVYWHLWD